MMPRSSLLARALLLLLLSVALVRPCAAWAAPPDIGQPAPDFTVQALDDTPFQLSTHQGRVVVLMFTAPSCGECVPELRALAQVHAEDASRGVDILALNIDPSTST